MSMTTVSLVGSTGSIGTQAVDVVRSDPDRFRVVALAAQRSIDVLAAQACELHPELVAVGDPALAGELRDRVPAGIEVVAGPEGLRAAAERGEVVVNGVVGFAGLPVTLAALEAGRRLGLANKESLIAGAPVVQRARRTPGAEIVPVDSEHCAIHQCLQAVADPHRGPDRASDAPRPGAGSLPAGGDRGRGPDRASDMVRRLLVTASGGPFRGRTLSELASVTVEDALAHPTWRMGPKITVDSSTLMNKGLEIIEAHELFGVPMDRIDVVVHPQSVVHSMVELVDGSTIAQLSRPDMRLPIGYAMGWPARHTTPFGSIDWAEAMTLTFEPPDREVFRCLSLAYDAGHRSGGAPAWLSAANEVAVEAFLQGRLDWLGIADVVAETLDGYVDDPMDDVAAVLEADGTARRRAEAAVARRREAA